MTKSRDFQDLHIEYAADGTVDRVVGARGTDLGFLTQANGGVRAVTDPFTGRVSFSANETQVLTVPPKGARVGTCLFGPELGLANYSRPGLSPGVGMTTSNAREMTVNGEQWFEVTLTADNTADRTCDIQIATQAPFSANHLSVEWQSPNLSDVISLAAYMGDSSWTKYVSAVRNIATTPTFTGAGTDPYCHFGRLATEFSDATPWGKTGFTDATNTMLWRLCKVRVTVRQNKSVVFRLRSFQASCAQGKGRLAIVGDDGYHSWLRLGVPILEHYGLRSSMAIIAANVGSTPASGSNITGYVCWDELAPYVGRGNECIAHGPNTGGGSGNLFTAIVGSGATATANRIADMNVSRDALLSRGLTSERGAQCYIWPQGQYASAAGEADLLDAAMAAGYRLARTATPGASTKPNRILGLSAQSHQRLTLPIIGHTYAGASNTADDAAETTNINNIITSVQALGTQKVDGVLMLHRVVARGAATAGSIEIEMDRLTTLAAAIWTEVDAGRLDVQPFSDLL